MFRSSQQRNSRCKDFKVKHALQICVLLGVCIWMAYLVQHSREKKRSYGEGTNADSEVVKLGRKDPDPNVEQSSSILHARDKEEKDEEENNHEKQKKTDDVNRVENEIQTQKNEQNNNEEKSEQRKDPVDQDTEENEHKANKESDSVIKENEDNKNKVEEDNQSRGISEEKNETKKEETDKEEDEEINQNRTEARERMEEDHKQEDEEESNATDNEREENDHIQEVDSPEDRVRDQNSERNNEEAKEEYYASSEGLNKTKQSDKRENNEFELESQTNGTEVAHVHENERVLNVTQRKATQVTNSVVTNITNQGNGSENQAEKKNDSQKSSIAESDKQEREPNKPSSDDVEALHSQNGTDTTEKQLETPENSKVEDSILHNSTLTMKDLKSDAAVEQVDSILTNSSGAHERNVTNGEYNGKANANGNSHDGSGSASDSSIVEGKDASSRNNGDAGQVEDENIDTSKNEDRAQNEPAESSIKKEESAH